MAECLLVLDTHPNAQARLHDPFDLRRCKLLSYALDFSRLNRRMHDRSFTVDEWVSIPGGRNVGDEYFGTVPTIRRRRNTARSSKVRASSRRYRGVSSVWNGRTPYSARCPPSQ